MSKVIRPPDPAAAIAAQSEPGPLSLVLVTVVAAATESGAENAEVPSATTVCVATICMPVATPETVSEAELPPAAMLASPRNSAHWRGHEQVDVERRRRGDGARQRDRQRAVAR